MDGEFVRREFNPLGAGMVAGNALFWGVVGGLVGKWLIGDPLDLPTWVGLAVGGVFPFCIAPALLLTVGPLVGAAFFTTYRRVR